METFFCSLQLYPEQKPWLTWFSRLISSCWHCHRLVKMLFCTRSSFTSFSAFSSSELATVCVGYEEQISTEMNRYKHITWPLASKCICIYPRAPIIFDLLVQRCVLFHFFTHLLFRVSVLMLQKWFKIIHLSIGWREGHMTQGRKYWNDT